MRTAIKIHFILTLLVYARGYGQYNETPIRLNATSLDSLRFEIERALLGSETIPAITGDSAAFDPSLQSYYYGSSPIVESITLHKIQLKNNFTSCVYHLKSSVKNRLNIPVIYHSGHNYGVFLEDEWINNSWRPYSARVMDYFLKKGYDVIGIDMPLYSNNEFPASVTENGAEFPIYNHDNIFSLENPFYYFMAPVKSTIDYFRERYGYREFVMLGLSGGGWTTTVYSAFDTAIKLSFPVAGSIPIPLRAQPRDYGDMEQYYYPFYDRFNYTTLYTLGAAGEGRLQYQVLNLNDDCCFAFNADNYWSDSVKTALIRANSKGTFKFFYDTFALSHRISSVTLDTISASIINCMGNRNLKNSSFIAQSRQDNFICYNDSMKLWMEGAMIDSIQWYRNGKVIENSNNTEIFVKDSGTYYAKLHNISGASVYSDSVSIVKAAEIRVPMLNATNNNLYSSSAANNTWYFNDELIRNENDFYLRNPKPGKYTVRYRVGSCFSELSTPFYYGVVLFPNPAKDQVNIQAGTGTPFHTYTIKTIDGITVQQGPIEAIRNVKLRAGLKTGIYLVELIGNKGSKVTKKLWIKP